MELTSDCECSSSVTDFKCQQQASEIADGLRETLKDKHITSLVEIRKQQQLAEGSSLQNQQKLYKQLILMRDYNSNIKNLIFKAKSHESYATSHIEIARNDIIDKENQIRKIGKEELCLQKDMKFMQVEQRKALEKTKKELADRITKLRQYESQNEEKIEEVVEMKRVLKENQYGLDMLENKISELKGNVFEAKKQVLVTKMNREKAEKVFEKETKELSEIKQKIEAIETQLETQKNIFGELSNRGNDAKCKKEELQMELEQQQDQMETLKQELFDVRDRHARCHGKNSVQQMIKDNLDKSVEKKKLHDRTIRLTLDKHRKKEKELLEVINGLQMNRKVCEKCNNKAVYSNSYIGQGQKTASIC